MTIGLSNWWEEVCDGMEMNYPNRSTKVVNGPIQDFKWFFCGAAGFFNILGHKTNK